MISIQILSISRDNLKILPRRHLRWLRAHLGQYLRVLSLGVNTVGGCPQPEVTVSIKNGRDVAVLRLDDMHIRYNLVTNAPDVHVRWRHEAGFCRVMKGFITYEQKEDTAHA